MNPTAQSGFPIGPQSRPKLKVLKVLISYPDLLCLSLGDQKILCAVAKLSLTEIMDLKIDFENFTYVTRIVSLSYTLLE